MPAVTSSILATAAVAGTAYSTYQGIKGAIDAKGAAEDATAASTAEADALIAEQQKQAAATKALLQAQRDQADDITQRNNAAARTKSLAQTAYGKSSTILTSPLGVPTNPAATASKTLLGS